MNLVEIGQNNKKICKKILGLGCCDKTASETDFSKHTIVFHENLTCIDKDEFW